MTHREIGEYLAAQNTRRTEAFREQAVFLNGLFRQWAATQQKHPRALSLRQLYPELFGTKRPAAPASPEERARAEARQWHTFLGI